MERPEGAGQFAFGYGEAFNLQSEFESILN